MMLESSLVYERTPEQLQDPEANWRRPNKAFFAAGACHILAIGFTRRQRRADQLCRIVHIRPTTSNRGHHMYGLLGDGSPGAWAFDFNGWTPEPVLLGAHAAAYRSVIPGWGYERVLVPDSDDELFAYLQAQEHALPQAYWQLPWERTDRFLRQFPDRPPESS